MAITSRVWQGQDVENPPRAAAWLNDLGQSVLGGSQLVPSDFGLIGWTFPPVAAAGIALTSQTIFCCGIRLAAGAVLNNIWMGVQTAAAGTTPTTIKLAIVDQTGARVATTGNLASDSKWTSTGYKSFALSSQYTVPSDGVYLVAALSDGTFGTTPLQVGRLSIGGVGAINSVYGSCLGGTGQTDIGSSITLAAATTAQNLWVGLS